MRAVQFTAFGSPPEVCECVDVADPGPPGAGEVVVAIEAAAINPADLLIIEGRYPGVSELPARLGIEGAGRVVAVGPDVTGLSEGDPVMSLGRANWAERVKLKAEQVIRVPPEADMRQMGMLKANPASAHLMLRDYVELAAGDWVIQNAANSAVGRHVIRLGGRRGIRTVNVARREALVAELEGIGADAVVVDGDDLAARVRDATGGAGIRLAIDAVGGPATQRLADCLADDGTVVNYGFLSGEPCRITPAQTVFHGITLTGFWLARLLPRKPREEVVAMYDKLARLFVDGTLQVPVEATYPLQQAKEALAHAAREGRGGKVLFTPSP